MAFALVRHHHSSSPSSSSLSSSSGRSWRYEAFSPEPPHMQSGFQSCLTSTNTKTPLQMKIFVYKFKDSNHRNTKWWWKHPQKLLCYQSSILCSNNYIYFCWPNCWQSRLAAYSSGSSTSIRSRAIFPNLDNVHVAALSYTLNTYCTQCVRCCIVHCTSAKPGTLISKHLLQTLTGLTKLLLALLSCSLHHHPVILPSTILSICSSKIPFKKDQSFNSL